MKGVTKGSEESKKGGEKITRGAEGKEEEGQRGGREQREKRNGRMRM